MIAAIARVAGKAVLASAVLLLLAAPAGAQGVVYGYYVPYAPVYYGPVYSAPVQPVAATYGAAPSSGPASYYTQDNPAYTGEGEERARPARIRVRMPAGAELWVDGARRAPGGAVREFETPDLDPTRVYTYTFRARWVEGGITVEKRVRVRAIAGNRVVVNFVPPPAPVAVARAPQAAAPSAPVVQPPIRWTAPRSFSVPPY